MTAVDPGFGGFSIKGNRYIGNENATELGCLLGGGACTHQESNCGDEKKLVVHP